MLKYSDIIIQCVCGCNQWEKHLEVHFGRENSSTDQETAERSDFCLLLVLLRMVLSNKRLVGVGSLLLNNHGHDVATHSRRVQKPPNKLDDIGLL